MAYYLVCYDIADPKRLVRLHRFLKKRALAIQYSVFLLRSDRRAIDGLLEEARALIDGKADDLRCYRLPKRGFSLRLGAAVLPDGLHLTDLPAPLRAPVAAMAPEQPPSGPGQPPSGADRGRRPQSPAPAAGRRRRRPPVRPLRRGGVYIWRD